MTVRLITACVAVSFASAAGADVHHIDWSAGEGLPDGKRRPATHEAFWPSGHDRPARLVRVEIPPGERFESVTLVPEHERWLEHVPRRVSPGEDRTVDMGPARLAGGYRYWMLGETRVRGHRIANVAVLPVRESGGRTFALERFALDVRTSTDPSGAPLKRRVLHPRTEAADDRANARLLDTPPLEDPTRREGGPPDQPVTPLEYVVVTNEEMAPAFQELADIKTREGMPAILTTVDWILASYEGIDAAARVRAYLRDLYLHRGLRYALLAGDTGQVPFRLALNRFQSTGTLVTADAYFACLDGDWNADGDAEIGEAPDVLRGIEGDHVDLAADIFVSRAPVSSAGEAAAFVAKWKSYTGHDPATFRDDYQNRILALGEVLFPADWQPSDGPGRIIKDGADFCESTLVFVPDSFERTRLYQYHDNPDHQPALPELKETVIAEINTGYGFIDHVGHGFRTNMSVGDDQLINADADAFTNTNAYSVLYAVNCTSGAILFDCIGERLINNPSGGVVASISSSDLDYPTASDVFKYEFFRLVFEEGVTRLGDAYYFADLPQVPVATLAENAQRWTIMTLIAFGDPAMEIWTGAPDTLDVAFDPTVEVGTSSVEVTVTDDGVPVSDATVCLSKDDAYAVAMSDVAGVATLAVTLPTTGTARITVTRSGYVPAADSTTVVVATDAALLVTAFTLQDGTPEGGIGNGDGGADAGESVLVDLGVRNGGTLPSSPGTATLDLESEHVIVSVSNAAIPALSPGEETTISAAFALRATPALPAGMRRAVAESHVILDVPEGSFESTHRFAVRQRILDLVASRFVITEDDGDGVLEAGETAEMRLTVQNFGDATAVGVVALVGNTNNQYVLLDDTVELGDISPGESIESPPVRLLSAGGDAGFALAFFASDVNRMAILARTLDGVEPLAPDTLVTEAGPSSIRTIWPLVTGEDVRGYRVYRAEDESGPFVAVTGIVDAGSFYEDLDVLALTPYSYRVTSVDWSGNESPPSVVATATTAPPFLEGWPVLLPSGLSKGSPTLADLDGDGTPEVVFGWSFPMVLRSDGNDYIDGDGNPFSLGIFATTGNGFSEFWTSPAVADIDADGVLEIVYAAWQVDGVARLWVLDATGAVEPGWPQVIGRQPWSTACVGDVDGDGMMEIFVSSGEGAGPLRGALFGFRHDGTEILDGDGVPSTIGIFHRSADANARFMYGSPALADLDGDDRDEVIFLEKTSHLEPTASTLYAFDGDGSVLPGFPYGQGALRGSTSSPAVANLDADPDLEIVIVTENTIAVVNPDGTDATGWPRPLPAVTAGEGNIKDFLSSPAIGDVNGDGDLDVALGWTDGQVHLFTGSTGQPHAGFPATVIDGSTSFNRYLHSPTLGNVDADPLPEILCASGDGRLTATNHDGTSVRGFPLRTASVVNGAPALWDIDGDGNVNLIVQSEAPVLEVFDLASVPFDSAAYPWPGFRHDARKSGAFGSPTVPPSSRADLSETPDVPAAASVGAPRPNPSSRRRVSVPFEVPSGGADVVIGVFDVTGREVRTLADGRFPAGAFEIRWDGRSSGGRPLGAGIYLLRVTIGERTFGRKLALVH